MLILPALQYLGQRISDVPSSLVMQSLCSVPHSAARLLYSPTQHLGQAVRKRLLEVGASKDWKSRKDKLMWRGALGCAAGCGTRGKAYFPTNSVKYCVDDSPHWDPNEVGYVYGCVKDKAAFNHERIRVVEFSLKNPECIDARFTALNEHRVFIEDMIGQNRTQSWLGSRIEEESFSDYRYVLNVGNNGFADRLWRLLAMGSTIFWVQNGWKEFYYDLLIPWKHYIPVQADLLDLCSNLEWARANPEKAKAIGLEARRFVENELHVADINQYVYELLKGYGELYEAGHRDPQKWHFWETKIPDWL
mmetsp:Transcript_20471/g.32016  ORF Transcript_20471/g.32016 Transcript_20471/m.32016 type:complete len:305 (+) Transcript_20471:440-1354(+)